MTFKPALWHPIAVVLSVFNFAGFGFAVGSAEPWHATAHAVLALAFWLWAQRLRQGPGASELARVKQQLEQQAAALEDTRTTLADQSTQLAELQERVDFAERLLAQARDRMALGTREERR
ncbi:MAG: hypothetical protein HY560_12025 [Gemmatimonadetes bacterium]|nr:hypothetical protein [Gemmatimonadota bacterium]